MRFDLRSRLFGTWDMTSYQGQLAYEIWHQIEVVWFMRNYLRSKVVWFMWWPQIKVLRLMRYDLRSRLFGVWDMTSNQGRLAFEIWPQISFRLEIWPQIKVVWLMSMTSNQGRFAFEKWYQIKVVWLVIWSQVKVVLFMRYDIRSRSFGLWDMTKDQGCLC